MGCGFGCGSRNHNLVSLLMGILTGSFHDTKAAKGNKDLFFFGSEKFVVFFKTSNDRYIKVNSPFKNLDQRPGTLSQSYKTGLMYIYDTRVAGNYFWISYFPL